MKASAGIPLGLLLLCAALPCVLGDVKEEKEGKQGECPRVRVKCAMMNPPERCSSDAACTGDQKCCEVRCGTDCTDPVKVKAGQCPHITATCDMLNPPEHCSSDDACPGDQKCCPLSCGTNCTDPVKAGECPNIKARCLMANPPVLCRRDSACPGDQKCCELACSTNCTDPVKPGACPNIKARCFMANPPVHCHSDSACPGDQKCCELACSTNCTDPVKPGECPNIKARCFMANPPVLCKSDSACPGDQKCCELACGTNCTDPTYPAKDDFPGHKLRCTPDKYKACERKHDPVCGVDGTTYSNECEMCRITGELNTNVCAKHMGECNQPGKRLPCEGYPSLICTQEYIAHCGSNGVTYANRCAYCNKQVTDDNLSLLFLGHCYNDQPRCE